MMRKIVFFLAAAASGFSAMAQQVRPANSATVYHELCRMKNLTHVLYVAAHPDDENTRFLAWMVNEKHIRTAYLSLTRGDGGQNILGNEQGPALGLIRTHELMEARKIDGAEQFFSQAIDFGFSKTSDETFLHWNPYILAGNVAYVIRKFRPDVVICRFPPTKEAGHGQHAASAIIAAKAFPLAGDKMQYTEQFKYVAPWQPKRLLFNAFRFGNNNTTSETQFKIPVGQYNPLLGMGYGELAGISRSVHKSQGAGTPSVAGTQIEYFKLVQGDTLIHSLFDGIDTTWNRVGRNDIGADLEKIIAQYDFKHPENSIPALLELRGKIKTVTDTFWRNEKLADLDQLILHASGFMAELVTKQSQTVAGATLPFSLNLIARSGKTPLTITAIAWPDATESSPLTLKDDSLTTINHTITIPANTPITQPYWLAAPATGDMYPVISDTLLGLPETPDNLVANVTVKLGSETLIVPVPLSYKKLDPVKGDVIEGLRIVPEITVEPGTSMLVTKADGSLQTSVRIHAYKDMSNATLNIFGNNKSITSIHIPSLVADEDTAIALNFSAAQVNAVSKDDFYMDAEVVADGKTFNKALKLIQYPHLPTLQYFMSPMAKVVRNNWKVTVKKIGYIEGAGDYTAMLMRLAGLQVDVLKDADLTDANKLKQYETIVTGVRAVNVEKKMAYWMPVLMEYVKNGGTLVMQYNTLQDLSTTNIGPYPFTLSTLRTTEEDAPVTITDSKSRLLNYPNKITDEDFKYWVQERGLYFPSKWDERYATIFEMNDKGETPQKSAVLYAKYGKGNYIYTTLSLFRQLPAGNKGAIRLFMNMISVGK